MTYSVALIILSGKAWLIMLTPAYYAYLFGAEFPLANAP